MAEEKHAADRKQELLTREQHTMWRSRHQDEMKSLGPDQKKEFNQRLRGDLQKMSAADLAKTRAALQAEWDALPADRKERIERRIADKNAK